MRKWMATVEVDKRRVDRAKVGAYLAALDEVGGSIGEGPSGNAQATVIVPAETLAQACALACAVVAEALGAPAIACEVTTEHEAMRRLHLLEEAAAAQAGDVVSVTEAAEMLGVSRQAVLQRIESGSLPAERKGRQWMIPRTAVAPGRPGRPSS